MQLDNLHKVNCIRMITLVNNKYYLQDFPPEVFLEDTTAANKIYNNLVTKGRKEAQYVRDRYEDLLSDPKLFIRKWIGQVKETTTDIIQFLDQVNYIDQNYFQAVIYVDQTKLG